MTGVYAALGAVLLLAVVLVASRNGLVRRRNRVREAYAAIDVQLTRRHTVVPQWVAAVQGAQEHERTVLERVARAADAIHWGTVGSVAAAENELTSAVAVVERYATLHSNQNALRLHEDLLSTENRVAFARQHYNDSAMLFNSAVQVFPRNLVAALFRIRPVEYLELRLLHERPRPV